jgi:hypothetical protein
MVVRNQRHKKAKEFPEDLAIAAIEGNPNPLDADMTGIDPAPTSLDLPLPGKPDNRHAAARPAHTGGRAKKR